MKQKQKLMAVLGVACLAAVSLSACSKPAPDVIKIASKPMTEQYILTEILGQLIENDLGVKVEITKGVGGGTTNIHPALLKGEFDLYPEYTGTGWLTVLKKEQENDSQLLYTNLKKAYEDLGLHWTGLYGFQNSYVLAVRSDLADQYQLSTFSDLASISDNLVFGGNPDYMEREDGLNYLSNTYNMNFKELIDIDIALKYTAMSDQQIDVTNAFTTDAQLNNEDITLLQDDQQAFATYYAGTVVRKDTLEKYPSLSDTLEKLTGMITDEEMRSMNYDVEMNQKAEQDVAREFLIGKGLIK